MARVKGFKDVYVAKVTKNIATEYLTGTPVKLFNAISGKVNVKRSSDKTYSDDTVEEIIDSFDSVEIEIEGDNLSMAQLALIFGATLENGILDDSINDESHEVAIGFRAKIGTKYRFHWYFCGRFGESDEDSFETIADKIKSQTKTLKGIFYGRSLDGKFRRRIHEDELVESDTDAKTAIQNWFSSVPGQTGKISVVYTDYTTGAVSNISIAGVTFDTATKTFNNVPINTTTFTFKVATTSVTATLSNSTWSFA